MAFPPAPLRRSSGSSGSGGFNPSPTKSARFSQQQTVHNESMFVGLLTKTQLKQGVKSDSRGERIVCVVCDEEGNFHLMQVFGREMAAKFGELNKMYRISKFYQQLDESKALLIMNCNQDIILSKSQIHVYDTATVALENGKEVPMKLPIFDTKTIMQKKVTDSHVSFIGKVTENLGKEKVGQEPNAFWKQRYRVADKTGNIQFAILGDNIEIFGPNMVPGKTIKFNMLRSFVNGNIAGGIEVSFCWYSTMETVTGSQNLTDVVIEQGFQQIKGQIDAVTIWEVQYRCPNCSLQELTFHEKMVKCNSCKQAARKSSVLEKLICEVVICTETNAKQRYEINEKVIKKIFGDHLESIKKNDDPQTAAFELIVDENYLFTINTIKWEIVDVEKAPEEQIEKVQD